MSPAGKASGAVDARCLFSIEEECQTTVGGSGSDPDVPLALREFLTRMRDAAPTLRGPSGLFNPYGRVYVDMGHHLELAAIECDSPGVLTQVVEAQHTLARRTVAAVAASGRELALSNHNHSGVLRDGTPVWGTHENYLIDVPATELAKLMIPFLVTRTYAGSGGVHFPSGQFVAGTRPLAMMAEVGGSTTHNRAIFSTCRQEHHMGPSPGRYRLHLIIGDGHRSHFNLGLQLGATALALKAVQADPDLPAEIRKLRVRRRGESWLRALRRLNRLAPNGEEPAVDPVAIDAQRVYLEAARRTVDRMEPPAPWMADILGAWQDTLDAYARGDGAWLSRRLDAFAKRTLFACYLSEAGVPWRGIGTNLEALSELTLLDHGYHAISEPNSVFARLERAGALDHRIAPRIEPGEEPEPWVPDVGTRARVRARFISKGTTRSDALVTWDAVIESPTSGTRWLRDPFATAFTDGDASPPAMPGIFPF